MQDETALMISCIPRLRHHARALVSDRAGADDLVQDTLERGWKNLSAWRRDCDMRRWLFGIMHNVHKDGFRNRAITTVELDEMTPLPAMQATQADHHELRDIVSALEKLPIEQREILLLVALEEMTYDEVASVLCIPIGTVMSRLSRGRERLRAIVEGRVLASPLKVVK